MLSSPQFVVYDFNNEAPGNSFCLENVMSRLI